MEYISVEEAAEKWGVSCRQVQRLLAEGRILYTKKYGRTWLIPCDAEKPGDPRRKQAAFRGTLADDLARVIRATADPLPRGNPEAVLHTVGQDRLQLCYRAEIAYLRGEFQQTLDCFHSAAGDDAVRLRIAYLTVSAAISLGNMDAYSEIATYLGNFAVGCPASVTDFAKLALATAGTSAIAPGMTPDWLMSGDIGAFALQFKPYVLYLRAKHLYCMHNFEAMLAVSQTALDFCTPENGVTLPEIYLMVSYAEALYYLGRTDEARRRLLDAMRLALPDGFVTPFAENMTALGGLVERCLEKEFPESRNRVLGQWVQTRESRVAFQNRFTRDDISPVLSLSLREYHIAVMLSHHVPYVQIAEQNGISVGRLKNIILGIYGKLFISSRGELSRYIV